MMFLHFARRAVAATLMAALAGCAITPPGSEPPRPGQPPAQALAAEVAWMQQWFSGTPVVVALDADGSMRIEVPVEFSFDGKSNAPKPPLQAVMDKVATSMTRQPSAKVHLASPGPVARGAAMRSHLQSRGVLALRVVVLAPVQAPVVTLRLVPGPIAIDKLDDAMLPPPNNAFPRSGTKPES